MGEECVLPALELIGTTSPAVAIDEAAPPGRGPRPDREASRLSGRG